VAPCEAAPRRFPRGGRASAVLPRLPRKGQPRAPGALRAPVRRADAGLAGARGPRAAREARGRAGPHRLRLGARLPPLGLERADARLGGAAEPAALVPPALRGASLP